MADVQQGAMEAEGSFLLLLDLQRLLDHRRNAGAAEAGEQMPGQLVALSRGRGKADRRGGRQIIQPIG